MRHAALILIGASVLALRAAGAADLTPAEAAVGKRLYVNKCARCHRFYGPAAYDDAAWNGWMVKMKQKARLSDREYAALAAYLQSVRAQAREPKPAR